MFQKVSLIYCIEKDAYNIYIVARHLRELIDYDKLPSPLRDEDIIVIGALTIGVLILLLKRLKRAILAMVSSIKRLNKDNYE